MGYKDKSSISKIENGKADIPQSKIAAFADALETTPAYLMGWEEQPAPQKPIPPGFRPLPEMVQVPLIGTIACGTPITAEQNVKSYIGIPGGMARGLCTGMPRRQHGTHDMRRRCGVHPQPAGGGAGADRGGAHRRGSYPQALLPPGRCW